MFSVDIYSAEGKLLDQILIEATSGHEQLDLSFLMNGMYILSIKGEDFHYSEKFIKE